MKRIESLLRAHEIAGRHREKAGAKPPLFAKKEDRGSLYIYEVIGYDFWTGGGVTGKGVADALEAMKGVKTLDIFINSEGGDVFEADAIFANLRRFAGEKIVHVDGIAASAASFIAMAGDQIVFSPVAMMMIHEARTIAIGRAEDMRATADLLDKANGVLADTYSKKTGVAVADVLEMMDAETWMTAKEALDKGFADSISEDETDDPEKASAKASSPFIAIEAQTLERSRLARQGHRVQQFNKTAPGQPGKERANTGQPESANPTPTAVLRSTR